jgi:hypothetical protein
MRGGVWRSDPDLLAGATYREYGGDWL